MISEKERFMGLTHIYYVLLHSFQNIFPLQEKDDILTPKNP